MKSINIDLLSDAELLDTRVKDLRLDGPFIYRDVLKVLYSLLNQKSIKWKPHVWPSSEWFSPDGVGGFAIPFTLYHPRLIALEKKIIGHCEGERKQDFLKLVAHETGHAIDNAYRLRKRKKRQTIFGLTSKRYPTTYTPNPQSTDYVTHLEEFYGQSHPDEDWAETFSVWLTTSNWKVKYKNTKAIEKLNYVNSVMTELADENSFKADKKSYQHFQNESRTVREVLMQKKKNLGLTRKNYYAKIIDKKFTAQKSTVKAYSYLIRNEKTILENLKRNPKNDPWTIIKSYSEIKSECRSKNYYLKYTSSETNEIIEKVIIRHAKSFKSKGRAKVFM